MTYSKDLVLYIDDEEVNLLLFEASFSKLFEVRLASSTKEAEALIEKNQFKVIVSDINMPYESGLEFLKRIKFKGIDPVLILLSAYINNNLLLEALNQGRIFRYLTKPWDFEEVKFTIEQAIQIFNLHYNNALLYQQVERSKQNFQNIFQSSKDGIVILNSNQIILEVNNALSENLMTVYPVTTGVNLNEYIPIEIHYLFWESIMKLENNDYTTTEFEYRPNSEVRKFFEVVNSKIEYQGTMANMCIFRDITERRQNEQKILNAVIQAEEKERSRLAKELHDGIGPIMATLKMYLEWLNDQEKITDHPDILNLSLSSINEAIVTLKNISNNLSPHILEKFGLVSALTIFIEKVRKICSLNFNLSLNLNIRFDVAIEMSVYRILTELLNNAVRHSGATEVSLELSSTNRILYFIYNDNGKGFDLQLIEQEGSGMGLYNIKNRIKTLGGQIVIQTEPGTGTKIECEIPIN